MTGTGPLVDGYCGVHLSWLEDTTRRTPTRRGLSVCRLGTDAEPDLRCSQRRRHESLRYIRPWSFAPMSADVARTLVSAAPALMPAPLCQTRRSRCQSIGAADTSGGAIPCRNVSSANDQR